MKVDFTALRSVSVFELPHREIGMPSAFGRVDERVRLAELGSVLYLPDVLDPGQGICVLPGGLVPNESVLDPFAVRFLATGHGREVSIRQCYTQSFDVAHCDERVCILGNLFSRNLTHWTEELIKVAVLEGANVDCRFVMSTTMPAFAAEFLAVLGIEPSRVLYTDLPTLFERVVFTTAVSHENIAAFPGVLERLRRSVLSRVTGASNYGRRLWLERGAQLRDGGVTLNKDEVYRCLEPHGFDIVDLAALPVVDQVATVRNADIIAGPHGSQLVYAQFMRPASTLIECLSPAYVNPSLLEICRALRHDYRQIVSRSNFVYPYEHGRNCHVDCAHLSLLLDSLCGADARATGEKA